MWRNNGEAMNSLHYYPSTTSSGGLAQGVRLFAVDDGEI